MNHGLTAVSAYSSGIDGVYLLISRCAIRGARFRCRVKVSNTQARHIHFSSTEMDSGGRAETSRGWIPFAGLGLTVAGFRTGKFLARVGLVAFECIAWGFARRAGFLAR